MMMDWDDSTCVCGSDSCDGECPAAEEAAAEAIAEEQRGIYLPAYCAKTDKLFCSKCSNNIAEGMTRCSNQECDAIIKW